MTPTIRLLSLLLAATLLAACATRHTEAPRLVQKDGTLQKTWYQGELKADDGTKIRYTVFQPALKPGATAPLIVQTHPFGFWRVSHPHAPIAEILTSGDVIREAWSAGYWVISFDQRGHGQSGDVMHIADPKKEGRDVSRIIDWAQKNLALTTVDGDPKVGMIGESYGAGIQLVASSIDPRIDAIVPIGSWYNLERDLAPNDVPKSGWLTLLVLAGNTIASYDHRLNGAYRDARGGHIDQWVRDEFADHDVSWFCRHDQAPHADALLFQGFRDVLFPVNEALDTRACLQKAGRDVRFIGVEDGHLLPLSQHTPGWMIGWNIEKELHCNGRTLQTKDVIFAWFEAKLRGRTERLAEVPSFCLTGDPLVDSAGTPPPAQHFAVAHVDVESGASGRLEWLLRPVDRLKNLFTFADGDWRRTKNGWLRPARVPLHRAEHAEWVVGVPHVSLDVEPAKKTAGVDRPQPVLFLQLATWRPGHGTYRVLDDQVTPVRGSGHIDTDLAAVRARLAPGEVVGLLVRGYQSQYRFSHGSWRLDAGIDGGIELPIAAATEDGGKKPAVASGTHGAEAGAL